MTPQQALRNLERELKKNEGFEDEELRAESLERLWKYVLLGT
jgi:hypothetical protein